MSEKRNLNALQQDDGCIGPMPDDSTAQKKAKGAEDVFCVCRGIETDKMIYCESKRCPIGWYHYECVGITEDTIPWGIWICKNCKQKSVLDFEGLYLQNLPSSEAYEKSYMHRDIVTHVAVTRKDFILTASCDGHVKFWRKTEDWRGGGIEFVKHFRSHLGTIEDMAVSNNGELACTVSDDKSAKIFDVVNFDMINMLKLNFTAGCCGWLYNSGDARCAVAICEKQTQKIHIYDGRGNSRPLYLLDKLHYKPVIEIKYSPVMDIVVSADIGGMVEFWTGPKGDYQYTKGLEWQYKTDTDWYDFVKSNCYPTGLCFSPDGKKIATIATDRKIRIFKVVTGKLIKVLDESLQQIRELQQMKQQLSNMEFGRRLAVEKELERSDAFRRCNILYDETGYFLFYGTMLGVKVINIKTNRCLKILGKPENPRFLNIALFQGSGKKSKAAPDVDSTASDNPILQMNELDPILFCTAYKKNRFYLFSRREPFDTKSHDSERDVFNEKPSKEEQAAATQDLSYTRVAEKCVIHTTMGDIHCNLFSKECPKTVENFCVHSKNGYYNNHLIHRVIKGFMIQTGDPLGNGTGGESIWGGEFGDEFHPALRHDRPYTLSMANAGPNTNGSQFFITVVPTPWLDNKHTVFGRVVKGMEVVHNISVVKTSPKTDKPIDDIRIVNINVK